MIRYKIIDTDFFLRSMKSISSVVGETILQFGKKLRTYGMDGSRICLYELVIGETELDIEADGKIDVMVDLSDLQKILQRFSSPDELRIEYDDNTIIIRGKIGGKNKTFRLRTLNEDFPEDPMEAMNKLKLDSVFNINLSDFVDMIGDMEIYAEFFTIKTVDDKLIISAEGIVGYGESEMILEDGITAEEESAYSLKFAKDILKTLGSQDVTVSFAYDHPIMIFNKLSKDSFIRWYLAPRVDE